MQDWLQSEVPIVDALSRASQPFVEAMRHGTMSVELYAPRGIDRQTPHAQDELYLIRSGTGLFSKAGEQRAFKPGDWIFVKAGVEHRFERFSEDFSTWVVFYGPKGGEKDGGAA
jgi:mannose-6-phosphate isomerase-like protein (cupin superfamily)